MNQSTDALPYYCSRCTSLYDIPDKLLACLRRHESLDTYLRHLRLVEQQIVVTVQ